MATDPFDQTGALSLQRLFVGSKSEGVYAVFDSDDGKRYRVRVEGREATDPSDPLSAFYNQRVRITAEVDRRMGHRRLTLHSDAHGIQGIEIVPIEPEKGV